MTENQQSGPQAESGSQEGLAQTVVQFCEDLVGFMNLDLNVTGSEVEGAVHVNLSGPDRPLLLSNTASLLNSIEYLLNKAFRTGQDAKLSSIVLDSESYRQHREAELTLLARIASEKVLSQGKPLSLQPMTPKERRIVHLALAMIEGVRSQSQGDGESRSITIYPS